MHSAENGRIAYSDKRVLCRSCSSGRFNGSRAQVPKASIKKLKRAEGGTVVEKSAMSEDARHERGPRDGKVLDRREIARRGSSLSDGYEARWKATGDRLARSLFAEGRKKLNAGPDLDRKEGLNLLKRAALSEHVQAHAWLGVAYDYGLGTRPNRRIALQHYLSAARAGNANAEYHVGVFYHDGLSVQRNYEVAVEWFERAADHGDAEAHYALGQCYRYSRGVVKDLEKGFGLLLEAARRRVVEAQFSLGLCFSRGEGVPCDPAQAFRWYLAAAKRGHSDAAFNLACLYGTGRGVKQNRSRAEFWLRRAGHVQG